MRALLNPVHASRLNLRAAFILSESKEMHKRSAWFLKASSNTKLWSDTTSHDSDDPTATATEAPLVLPLCFSTTAKVIELINSRCRDGSLRGFAGVWTFYRVDSADDADINSTFRCLRTYEAIGAHLTSCKAPCGPSMAGLLHWLLHHQASVSSAPQSITVT